MHWNLPRRLVPRRVKESIKTSISRAVSLSALDSSVRDLQVQIRQLEQALQFEHRVPPVAPKHLQTRVVGGYSPDFVKSGYRVLDHMSRVLKVVGRRLEDFSTILDFGCGCGRVIRALRATLPEGELHGSDIDTEAIGWLQQNCSSIATFYANPHVPPTAYAENTFDLIYSISIFSHLPEQLQFAWLQELQRIARPDGLLILTTHGEEHENLPPGGREIVKQNGFYFLQVGKTEGLPDFYQAAFQSEKYLREEWGRFFEVLHIEHKTVGGQEMVLLRKRSQ